MQKTTGEHSPPPIGVTWVSPGQEKSERYLRAVSLAGGRPVPLLAGADAWRAKLNTIRGLLLTGGGDVDPRLYGEENEGLSKGVNRQRDDLEMEALDFCLERGLPVLAICRGFQLVNVAMGGSLLQDIASPLQHRPVGDECSFHEVEVVPGTKLAALLGGERLVRVNSRHHQGVDLRRAAPKLRVTALAWDGIVEGLELPEHGFFLAVQSHPEYLEQVPQLSGLFAALVAGARAS